MIDTTRPVDRTGNNYCGPLVLAAICGTSTGEIVRDIADERARLGGVRLCNGNIKRVRGRTPDKVRGTYDSELFMVLNQHGCAVENVDVGARYRRQFACATFINENASRFAKGFQPWDYAHPWSPCTMLVRDCRPLWLWLNRLDNGVYIVHVPGHWAIAANGKWCETYTNGVWVDKRHAPKGNRKVIEAWKVIKPGQESV